MNFNYKRKILSIDVIIQKIFLYWIGFSILSLLLVLFLNFSSLFVDGKIESMAFVPFWSIILLLLFLPILGVFNLIINFFHYKYGSYSKEIKSIRFFYNIATLIFLILLGIYGIAYKWFDYFFIDAIIIFLIVGGLFAIVHSYITFLENKFMIKCNLIIKK